MQQVFERRAATRDILSDMAAQESNGANPCSLHWSVPVARLSGRRTNCVDQCTRWKWLPQECCAPGFQGLEANGVIVCSSHEYDCKLGSGLRKASSEFNAG